MSDINSEASTFTHAKKRKIVNRIFHTEPFEGSYDTLHKYLYDVKDKIEEAWRKLYLTGLVYQSLKVGPDASRSRASAFTKLEETEMLLERAIEDLAAEVEEKKAAEKEETAAKKAKQESEEEAAEKKSD